jgi:hypothetical protein
VVYGGGSWVPFADQAAYVWFPNGLLGAITGLLAVSVTAFLVRRSNLMAVATAVSIVWVLLYAVGIILNVSLRGFDIGVAQGVSIAIGIVLGSFSGARESQ